MSKILSFSEWYSNPKINSFLKSNTSAGAAGDPPRLSGPKSFGAKWTLSDKNKMAEIDKEIQKIPKEKDLKKRSRKRKQKRHLKYKDYVKSGIRTEISDYSPRVYQTTTDSGNSPLLSD